MAMAASDTGWSDMSPGSRSVNTTTTTTTTTGAPRPPQRPPQSYTDNDWDGKQEIIKYLFLDQDMPLLDVVEALSVEYDFHTNERMCKTRLKKWGFKKNSSKNRPSSFRDKRPVKSQDTRDRTARRLGGKTKKAATHMPDRPEGIEQPIQGPPEEAPPGGNPLSLPVNTPIAAWTAGAELSWQDDAAGQEASIYEASYQSADRIDGGLGTSQGFNSEADSYLDAPMDVEQGYEETCPYRHGEFKFRLMQDLGSGAMHQTDVLSDGSQVDVFDKKPCSPDCACCRPDHFPSAFAFLACTAGDNLDITMFSNRLREELLPILPEQDRMELEKATFSGLVLLKHFYQIRRRLEDAHMEWIDPSEGGPLSPPLELELLYRGILSDCDIISTLGYEKLHAKGFLSYDLWQYFQEVKLQSNINRLDDTFLQIDESEGLGDENQLCSDASDCWCGAFPEYAQRSVEHYERWIKKLVCDGDTLQLQSVLEHLDGPWAPNFNLLQFYAVRHGRIEVIKLLLQPGMRLEDTFASMLDRAIFYDQIETVHFLLGEGPNEGHANDAIVKALNEAVYGGQNSVVEPLLASLASVDKLSHLPFESWLHFAAWKGQCGTVRLLLHYGANADEETIRKSPLLSAASEGHLSVDRLARDLCKRKRKYKRRKEKRRREQRARVVLGRVRVPWLTGLHHRHPKFPLFRSIDSEAVFIRRHLRPATICWGISPLTLHLNDLHKIRYESGCRLYNRDRHRRNRTWQSGSLAHRNVGQLRSCFRRQHSRMLEAAEASDTGFRAVLKRFQNHRDSWAAGLAVMRNLCRGRAPPTVLDVIQFLCAAKAMEETLGNLLCESYLAAFVSDLHRWQALFASPDKTADLEAYRDAVKSMWGVELDERADIGADINILGKFQSLANSLAARASILLDDAFGRGPDPGQNRAEGGGGHDCQGTASDTSSRDQEIPPPDPEPKPPDPLDNGKDLICADDYHRGHPTVELVVANLIAGAAFVVFLIFLQVLQKLSNLTESLRTEFPPINTMSQRLLVFENEIVKGRSLVRIEGFCGDQLCWV